MTFLVDQTMTVRGRVCHKQCFTTDCLGVYVLSGISILGPNVSDVVGLSRGH
jgi:hypothetical protein